MTLGAFLTQLRQGAGRTRAQWANAAGVSRMTVYRWETGQTLPHVYEMAHALRTLDASPRQRRDAFALRQSRQEDVLRGAALERERIGIHRGDLLRALRGRRGWSSEETARRIGVSPSLMRKWEALHSWPNDERLHQLAYVLGASAEELLALCGGIGALESLAPPTFHAMYDRIGELYILPERAATLEPLMFAMAHRAQTSPPEAEGVPDFPLALGLVHAALLLREGRSLEARQRFRQATAVPPTSLRAGTRLAQTQVQGYLTRGYTALNTGPLGSSAARRWRDSVEEASAWEGNVTSRWRAALASERAFALWYAGDSGGAIAESERSLLLASQDGPSDVLVRLGDRGRLLYESGRYERLLDELPAYVGRSPETDIHLNLYIGLAHQSLGDTSSAHECLTLAATLAAARRRPVQAEFAAAGLSRL